MVELVVEYLSVMGHNVISSTLIGRNTEVKESQNPQQVFTANDATLEVSSWHVVDYFCPGSIHSTLPIRIKLGDFR